ncbi:MAG TPA: response regulator [Gemmatimonadales bacterium]
MIPAAPGPRPSQRRTVADRRSARTRRSGQDRRQNERRGAALSPARRAWAGRERRAAERRRHPDRRGTFDRRFRRRRDTPTPYSAEETGRIQRMFQTAGQRGTCPACGSAFVLSSERRRGADRVRKVECSTCGKAAVVTNTWTAKLLFVASDTAVRDGVRSMMVNAGHDVSDAADLEGALRVWRESPQDVVVVDLSVPGRLDGQDVIRRLRSEFADVPVVAMGPRASYGVADPLAAARQLGALRTLRMPFSTPELLTAIAEARRG